MIYIKRSENGMSYGLYVDTTLLLSSCSIEKLVEYATTTLGYSESEVHICC